MSSDSRYKTDGTGSKSEEISQELRVEPPRLTIRRANLDDLDALVQLRLDLLREVGSLADDTNTPVLAEAIRRYLTEKMPTGKFMVWVAEIDGQIVGTSGLVILERPPDADNLSGLEGYVLNMYTVPEWRARGIATALLKEIIGFMTSTEGRRLCLHTTQAGKPVYEKAGFVLTSAPSMELVW